MDGFARIVLGYHGCLKATADELLSGTRPIHEWKHSDNAYDWLGKGIYFWEHSPSRALRWAREKARREGHPENEAAVVGAVIHLGRCFDLTDESVVPMLAETYDSAVALYSSQGKDLPRNRGARRDLDCFVINFCLDQLADAAEPEHRLIFKTVRGPFLEGDPVYDGSFIMKETHIQIAVRDPACILGVFRPNLG